MAGRGHRTYSRKKSNPPISQFDRLISDASNSSHHPVAAKTARHVGKWGMTSYTSLRSINGKEENLKRSSSSDDCDPFGFDGDTKIDQKVTSTTNQPVKRRKFFKSRDVGIINTVTSEVPNVAPINFIDKPPVENKLSIIAPLKRASVFKDTIKIAGGGGIKLKIFKSRNTSNAGTALISPDIYSSSIQLPSDDSSNSSYSSNGTSGKADSITSNGNDPANAIPTPSTKTILDIKIPSIADTSLVVESESTPNSSFNSFSDTFIKDTTVDVDQSDSALSNHCSNNNLKKDLAKCDFLNTNSDETIENTQETESSICSTGIDLFGTDFDENEIIDRTSMDFFSAEPASILEPEKIVPSENVVNKGNDTKSVEDEFLPLHRSKTIDTTDLEPSSSSFITASELPKTLSESSATNTVVSKKRSIFKSRQRGGGTELKKRATYTHKWHGHEEKEKRDSLENKPTIQPSVYEEGPFDFDGALTKVQSRPVYSYATDEQFVKTSVKCPKEAKKFYTVIKNVKKTHQLQESGEFQEFNDDVEYFLDALRSTNKVATRCLASLNLAQKSMVPSFRMHLRAHSTVTKFFRALLDAPNHPHLAECAAMVMFALSQDRLNMDLDRSSLELMLNLLDTDSSTSLTDINSSLDGAEHISKIKALCKELQGKGHAKHLKLNQINAANLAMETLLSLTSKRAGEWFKEELRQLGGVDHLVRTVTSNASSITADMRTWTQADIDKLSRIDRCLKVLENVTHQNLSNQEYLLNMNSGEFSKTLMRLFWMCHKQIPLNPQTVVSKSSAISVSKDLVTTLMTTIKVLINLTHDVSKKEALGSKIIGRQDEIYNLTLSCLLKMPPYLNHDSKFEVQVLSCCLLLNLVEKSSYNRERLMRLDSPILVDDDDSLPLFTDTPSTTCTCMSSLVKLFYSSEENARVQEAHTDKIIDNDLTQKNSNEDDGKDEDIEETVHRLLQKAGRHMEDTLIAAYTALISGYCMIDNKEFQEEIRLMQPECNFKNMVAVLRKFLHFMNLTATTALLRSLKPTEQVVKHMENIDKEPEVEKKKEEELDCSFDVDDAFGF